MDKDQFLTVRWNNILSLALGLPTLAFIFYAFSGPLWTTRTGLIILGLIGAVY